MSDEERCRKQIYLRQLNHLKMQGYPVESMTMENKTKDIEIELNRIKYIIDQNHRLEQRKIVEEFTKIQSQVREKLKREPTMIDAYISYVNPNGFANSLNRSEKEKLVNKVELISNPEKTTEITNPEEEKKVVSKVESIDDPTKAMEIANLGEKPICKVEPTVDPVKAIEVTSLEEKIVNTLEPIDSVTNGVEITNPEEEAIVSRVESADTPVKVIEINKPEEEIENKVEPIDDPVNDVKFNKPEEVDVTSRVECVDSPVDVIKIDKPKKVEVVHRSEPTRIPIKKTKDLKPKSIPVKKTRVSKVVTKKEIPTTIRVQEQTSSAEKREIESTEEIDKK